VIILVVAIVSLVVVQKVGTSGGEIRHTEIRSDSTPSENGAKPEKHSEKDND
jgi:hypothetical protein